jgi:hypothetical protein
MAEARSKLISVLLLAGLVGCAVPTAPPRPPNPSVACFANIMRAPDVQPIADKLVFGARASLLLVSDNARPTPELQPAIQAAEARYSSCIELGTS